jgi:signal transduction histidine kinase
VRPKSQDVARLQPPVTKDVTALLLQSQRHHAFILTLAHELRQPLSAMLGAIEILRDGRSAAGMSKAVEVIDRQAHQMARLVEEVVESARWTRGTALLRTERVDLRIQIAEALADAGEAPTARERQIVASDMPEPLWVDADPAHLRQVLSNLLDNAIKFTAPGGHIHLTACRSGREIIMRIRDTGRGLRPDELAHIFELFSQVRPGEGSGLGIGLHVASEIVALHKGRIEAHSDGPSCGSEFTVVLPAAASMS